MCSTAFSSSNVFVQSWSIAEAALSGLLKIKWFFECSQKRRFFWMSVEFFAFGIHGIRVASHNTILDKLLHVYKAHIMAAILAIFGFQTAECYPEKSQIAKSFEYEAAKDEKRKQ